ncbi:MAG: hypothetical protein GF405_04830 [Candidatus Eisenbacteria bacterium]|nr:hypothetical protein [Candidatus Eisenbacteria bacterium]
MGLVRRTGCFVKRNRATAVTAVAALVLFFVSAPPASASLVQDRLPNGVRVVVESGSWNRIVSVSVLADAGSKYDPPELPGLARVTNELLGYSTAAMSYADVCRVSGCAWIDFGTSTTEDLAEVHVSAVDEHLEQALDLVAAAVTEPSFTAEDLATVQVSIQKQLEHALDDPFERSFVKLNELLFEGHPYGSPVNGTLEGIERITPSDVRRFHDERYTGRGVVVSVVGDVDPDEIIEMVAERFGGLPYGRPPGEPTYPVERTGTSEFELFKDVENGRVLLGFLAPAADDPDHAAVRVLTEVLGGGTGSRLHTRLASDGEHAADAVGAFYPLRLEQGRIVAYATPVRAERTLDLMTEVVEALRNEPVSSSELKRASNRIVGHYVMRGQRNLERARRHAWDELSGLGGGAHDRLIRSIEEVDADDVLDAAQRYLVDPVIVVLKPGRPGRGGI